MSKCPFIAAIASRVGFQEAGASFTIRDIHDAVVTLFENLKICSAGDTDPEFEDDEDQNCPAESDGERSDGAGSDGDQSNDDGDQSNGDGDDDGFGNAGWAEAMAKILAKKTPASKSSILVKNKELDKVKEKEKQEQLERKKQVITPMMVNWRIHPS